MRCSGLIIVVAACVNLAGCRCDQAREQSAANPTQPPRSASSAESIAEPRADVEPSTAINVGSIPADATPIVVVKALDFAPVKGSRFLPMKLQQDGVITRKDEPVAKIENNQLKDDEGRLVASFVAPARLAIEGSTVSFTFNPQDELEGPDGLKVAVADTGIPTISRANEPPAQLTGKFVDFDPNARRAAAILLAIKEIKKAAKEARAKQPKSDGEKDRKKGKKKE